MFKSREKKKSEPRVVKGMDRTKNVDEYQLTPVPMPDATAAAAGTKDKEIPSSKPVVKTVLGLPPIVSAKPF